MIIYPDSCIYGRQRDDQTQPDIKAETLAIGGIIDICIMAGHTFIGSKAVEDEILANSNAKSRTIAHDLFKRIATHVKHTAADFRRAQGFMAQGLRSVDSLHLATAESAGADILLTVDKDFEKIATTKKLSRVRVINPLKFIKEVIT
ncbi:hypothetical protein R80B4_02877 [Fibrobacteres bacterium R8-0-B4]